MNNMDIQISIPRFVPTIHGRYKSRLQAKFIQSCLHPPPSLRPPLQVYDVDLQVEVPFATLVPFTIPPKVWYLSSIETRAVLPEQIIPRSNNTK